VVWLNNRICIVLLYLHYYPKEYVKNHSNLIEERFFCIFVEYIPFKGSLIKGVDYLKEEDFLNEKNKKHRIYCAQVKRR